MAMLGDLGVAGHMRNTESLVEAYLTAERDMVTAVDAVGAAVPLPDDRTVPVGRAKFDALSGRRRKRAWITVRVSASTLLPAHL